MSITPLAFNESLRIGAVDFVSPDQIRVLLDINAPDSIALNTGTARPFPRINGYVLVPSDEGYLVGQIEWITIEHSQYPKRKGMQDFGLIDLPFPQRKLRVNPLGALYATTRDAEGAQRFRFRRGVDVFPSVGDQVLLPTQHQLLSIIESGENRRVKIGTSPLAESAEVKIDPDRLFGRHLAVLGNTGSGKSCSVAGLIRWSLEAAALECKADSAPNARFVVLDPNGEYSKAFRDSANARVFSVEPRDKRAAQQLCVPLWFWNSNEWCAFTQASSKTQRPTLIQSLRSVRDSPETTPNVPVAEIRRFLRTIAEALKIEKGAGRPWSNFPHPKNFLAKLLKWRSGLDDDDAFSQEQKQALEALRLFIGSLEDARQGPYPTYDFERPEIDELQQLIHAAHTAFGGSDSDFLPIDADTPRSFSGVDLIRKVEANADLLGVTEHVETLILRIKTLLSDSRMKTIVGGVEGVTLEDWLKNYIGDHRSTNGTVTIIDLSLVPADVVHVLTSVVARMVFEALQRYRRSHASHKVLPTVLVMEEAHTFVRRYKQDAETHDAAATCCQLFERIAREGRKFGLGLVLSSQRPSELSPTVLSQCNTFLLHRISNDRDQDLVHKLVPDNLRGLLSDLPSLPSQNAILLGWASELPVLVRMNHLPKEQRPESEDPDFWDVWTSKEPREVDWKALADEWQQVPTCPTDGGQADDDALQGKPSAEPDDEDEILF